MRKAVLLVSAELVEEFEKVALPPTDKIIGAKSAGNNIVEYEVVGTDESTLPETIEGEAPTELSVVVQKDDSGNISFVKYM
jgi:hypothetical protein